MGDAIIGLPSSGLHTNGYTLARTALAELDWSEPLAELRGRTIGDTLLSPHRPYLQQITAWLDAGLDIRGLAHITGGGLVDNPLRILPEKVDCVLRRGAWTVPPVFDLIQRYGSVSGAEMAHVFNLGLGMLAFLPQQQVEAALRVVPQTRLVGQVRKGTGQVIFEP